jgi:protein-arginine kinase activator protein McsA
MLMPTSIRVGGCRIWVEPPETQTLQMQAHYAKGVEETLHSAMKHLCDVIVSDVRAGHRWERHSSTVSKCSKCGATFDHVMQEYALPASSRCV